MNIKFCCYTYKKLYVYGGFYMETTKKKVSIYVEETVIQKLKILAKEDNRTLSRYINVVLHDYLKTHTV